MVANLRGLNMSGNSVAHDQYRLDFKELDGRLVPDSPSWLSENRQIAFSEFENLGFPTTKRANERWKYTNVAPLARTGFRYRFEPNEDVVTIRSIRELLPWHEDWTRLVFVDGMYSDSLSNPDNNSNDVYVGQLREAMVDRSDVVETSLGSLVSYSKDGFLAANMAFLSDGAFVHVSNGVSYRKVIHLIFVSTGDEDPMVSYPRTLVLAGSGSDMTLVESYVGLLNNSYFTNAVTEVLVEDGSKVEHYRYMKESQDAFHVGTTRVQLGRDSTFSSSSFSQGSSIARNDLGVTFNSPGSSCSLRGLYQASDSEHVDSSIDIDHASPNCSSDQYFKGILDGDSRGVFSGKVLVRPEAQKTIARQADKNLLLSEGARINTKPSLEIFADDVVCSHGATAGALADELMFYMMSRGIDEKTARSLIVYGFASEIIDKFNLAPIRDRIECLLLDGSDFQ